MITQELLKELFEYRDGRLFWKVKRRGAVTGDEAGWLHNDGYRYIGINGKIHKTHRLIFLFHKGYLPKFVDHKEGVEAGDFIENLRECTASQNQHNRKINKNNASGIKGVFWCKHKTKWQAKISHKGKQYHVGFFSNKNAAKQAVERKRNGLHGEFANNG